MFHTHDGEVGSPPDASLAKSPLTYEQQHFIRETASLLRDTFPASEPGLSASHVSVVVRGKVNVRHHRELDVYIPESEQLEENGETYTAIRIPIVNDYMRVIERVFTSLEMCIVVVLCIFLAWVVKVYRDQL